MLFLYHAFYLFAHHRLLLLIDSLLLILSYGNRSSSIFRFSSNIIFYMTFARIIQCSNFFFINDVISSSSSQCSIRSVMRNRLYYIVRAMNSAISSIIRYSGGLSIRTVIIQCSISSVINLSSSALQRFKCIKFLWPNYVLLIFTIWGQKQINTHQLVHWEPDTKKNNSSTGN